MAIVGHFIVRFVWILIALAVAFLAAGLFLGVGYYGELVKAEALPPEFGENGIFALAAGLILTPFIAVSALAPALLLVAIAEVARLRGILVNLALGAGAAVIVFSLQAGTARLMDLGEGAMAVVLSAGFIAGAAYWLIAGRSAGAWLETRAKRARSAES
jgi:hypothetical protein